MFDALDRLRHGFLKAFLVLSSTCYAHAAATREAAYVLAVPGPELILRRRQSQLNLDGTLILLHVLQQPGASTRLAATKLQRFHLSCFFV